MRTPSLLGVALLCLFAMAAATDDDHSVSVEENQNYLSNILKQCRNGHYKDWYQTGSYCIKYFNTPRSFADAESACRHAASGSRLVSVHDEQTNADVLAVVLKYNSSSPRIWLGGQRLGQSKKFIWTDGSLWNFKKWVPGQPDDTQNIENCVEMNWKILGEWNDVRCTDQKPFVCAFKWQKRQQELED
ncbi:lectin-like [Brienomyrus brachyistius]|uniref:lectin-like n=1 Tax=Brienomyrus brachyistius TaxID=42636 RepID=UPI0020B2FA0A|nr:lectin-like [Brienomyrus brachyistius]